MESPLTTKRKMTEGDTGFPKVNCTPKTRRRSGVPGEEFSLYNLHGEASPNFRAGQDVLEVGWGDSPEPLNVEQKFDRNRGSPLTCKKKLETKDSPKSSIPFKRRNVQSTFNIPSKSIIDVAKYVAEVQELSKNIMKEFNAHKRDKDLSAEDTKTVSSNRLVETNVKTRSSPIRRTSDDELKNSCNNNQNKDSMFDSVLESFINEEDDDWLSQALSSQEQAKTPHKGNFVKSKSENELTLPSPVEKSRLTLNCRNINNNFRRTASFDLTKPHNLTGNNKNDDSDTSINGTMSSNQYSLQEIERKRLEAKYRRERREIERRKLEALKKLEMKKLRAIKT